jgi:hypothetical protein
MKEGRGLEHGKDSLNIAANYNYLLFEAMPVI